MGRRHCLDLRISLNDTGFAISTLADETLARRRTERYRHLDKPDPKPTVLTGELIPLQLRSLRLLTALS